jgi:hypothetical protein
MKTKDQVQEKLLTKGFSEEAVDKIMGFLIGAGLKEVDEKFSYRRGNGTWMEFYDWYTSDDDQEVAGCPVVGIVEELHNMIDETKDEEFASRLMDYIQFMATTFGEKIEEDEETVTYEISCNKCGRCNRDE